MPNNLTQWMKDVQTRTEIILQRLLPQPETLPQELHEVMRYAALDGGKRLRPMLVLAAAEMAIPFRLPVRRQWRQRSASMFILWYTMICRKWTTTV